MMPDLELFLPRIRALYPDTRGHGLSQKFERAEDYSYSEKCSDLLGDANVRLRMGDEALDRLKARPDRYAEVTGRLARHSVASLLALLDETYSRTDWLADCSRIRCPVQIISGGQDHFPDVGMSRRLASTIPGALLHVVPNGPHFPNRSHRSEVQSVIAKFFTEIGL